MHYFTTANVLTRIQPGLVQSTRSTLLQIVNGAQAQADSQGLIEIVACLAPAHSEAAGERTNHRCDARAVSVGPDVLWSVCTGVFAAARAAQRVKQEIDDMGLDWG